MQYHNKVIGILALAGSLSLAGCGNTESQESPASDEEAAVGGDGMLEKLSDGFPRQALSIIVVDEAGSDDGIYANQIQQAAEAYSPVPVKVVVRPDFGTYGSWEALNFMSGQSGVTTVSG